MAEIVLDVHDSNWQLDLGCSFEVKPKQLPIEKLLNQELEKFKKTHPELYAKLENDLKKIKEKQGG